jgi:BirA family transcriptional regulator, biotin operon repressor / biotin---[acetyl-CoA-carboxylase] ligase
MGTIGSHVVELDEVGSTNDHAAMEVARGRLSHGAVVVAHSQTAGRGQRGRVWDCAPGLDLAMSVVFQPVGLRADAQFVLARLSALAMREALGGLTGVHFMIKWPNDILSGSRKVAGILLENEVHGSLVSRCILGIGVNVNSPERPPELGATSLMLKTGKHHDLRAVRQAICAALDRRYAHWQVRQDDQEQEYVEALWGRGRWCSMELDGAATQAMPLSVAVDGRLKVELPTGQVVQAGLDRLRFGPRRTIF